MSDPDEKREESAEGDGQPDESKGPSDPNPGSFPSEGDLTEQLPGVPEDAEEEPE